MNKRQELFIILLLLIGTALLFYFNYSGNKDNTPAVTPANQPAKPGENILPSLSSFGANRSVNMIRTIYLSIISDQSKEVFQKINEMTPQYDGIISNSNITGVKDKDYSGSMSLLIPENKINDVLTQINRLNAIVTSERSYTQDSTQQINELQANISSLQNLESKYLEVLKTTKNVGDITLVTNKLTDVRSRIDTMRQQLSSINRATSSINIQIDLNPSPVIVMQDRSWSPYPIAVSALKSLESTLQWFTTWLVWIMVYLIPMTLLGFVAHLTFRFLSKKA